MPRYVAPIGVRRCSQGDRQFEVMDGIVDLPSDLGAELGYPLAPAAPSPRAIVVTLDGHTPAEAVLREVVKATIEPARFEESAAYLEARDGGMSHRDALDLAGLLRYVDQPEPDERDLALLREGIAAERERRALDSTIPDESMMRPVDEVSKEHDDQRKQAPKKPRR